MLKTNVFLNFTIIISGKHAYFEINMHTGQQKNEHSNEFQILISVQGMHHFGLWKDFGMCIFFTVYLKKIYTNMAWGSSLVAEHLTSVYNRTYILLRKLRWWNSYGFSMKPISIERTIKYDKLLGG